MGRPIVLLPGAWHGAWCWRPVADRLAAAGAEPWPLSLTGLGERAHLLGPDVGVTTHVEDVVRLLESEELEGVMLVGHSYAGVLLGGVAERAGGRVTALVYLDALVPARAQTALELFPEEVAAALRAANAGGRVPPWPAASFGVSDPAAAAWVDRRLTDHPFRTLAEPGAPPPSGIARAFIACTIRRRPTYVPFAQAAQASPDWEYAELACGHDAMVIMPGPLAEALLEFAGRL